MSLTTFDVPAPEAGSETTVPPEIAARLADPRTAEALAALIDHLDVIVLAVNSLDGLLAHSETILNSVIDGAKDAKVTAEASSELGSVDLKASADAGGQLIAALPRMAPALVRGVDSGAIDELTSPALVQVLHLVSSATGEALKDPSPVPIRGALGVAKALKDPDVARGVSFFLTIARAIGRQLSASK